MAEKRIRNNRFNVEWLYAKQCWDALVNGEEIPEVPNYTIFETDPTTGKEKVIGHKPIKPAKISYKGTVLFG